MWSFGGGRVAATIRSTLPQVSIVATAAAPARLPVRRLGHRCRPNTAFTQLGRRRLAYRLVLPRFAAAFGAHVTLPRIAASLEIVMDSPVELGGHTLAVLPRKLTTRDTGTKKMVNKKIL